MMYIRKKLRYFLVLYIFLLLNFSLSKIYEIYTQLSESHLKFVQRYSFIVTDAAISQWPQLSVTKWMRETYGKS